MLSRQWIVTGGVLLALSACSQDEPAAPQQQEPKTVSGRWTGEFVAVTDAIEFQVGLSIVIAQSGQQVTGTGTMTGPLTLSLAAQGAYVHPSLALGLTATGYEPMTLDCDVAATAAVAVCSLGGSGFSASVVMVKQ